MFAHRTLLLSLVTSTGLAGALALQCHDPAVLQESLRFYIQLMKTPNALSAARREMLATVVSNANDCYY